MSNRYAGLKPFIFADRVAGMRARKTVSPIHVQLVLSDLCNQDCQFCCFRNEASTETREWFADGEDRNPGRMLPFGKVTEILEDCQLMRVRGIELTGGGEPTIHPRFDEVTDQIHRRGMAWGLITNGVKHRDLSTARWVRVSLDAGTPETYRKIRRVPEHHFGKALDTIRKWRTNVSFVVTPENHAEILRAGQLARDAGAQSFRVRPQDDLGLGLFTPRILAIIDEQRQDVLDLVAPGFDVDFRFDTELSMMDQGGQDYSHCSYQYFKTWIGADQNLYRCCITAYSERGLIGSLKDRRFRDLWTETAMANFVAFDAHGCDQCRYGPTNRAVNEVLGYDADEAFV